eukprot:COSAG02_NODE_33168_length_504_cov_0.980247_1_plen_81_part_10
MGAGHTRLHPTNNLSLLQQERTEPHWLADAHHVDQYSMACSRIDASVLAPHDLTGLRCHCAIHLTYRYHRPLLLVHPLPSR